MDRTNATDQTRPLSVRTHLLLVGTAALVFRMTMPRARARARSEARPMIDIRNRPGGLAQATAAEVRTELGRRGLAAKSLDTVLTSSDYVRARLSVNATQPLDMNDLDAICRFLEIDPLVIMERAADVVRERKKAPRPPTLLRVRRARGNS